MRIVDVGSGPPVVMIPGVQGRWEWMKPAVDALASRVRVITFSLADEPSSQARFDPSIGFDNYVEQVREALDTLGLQRAAICGVSYGGLIAAAFVARYPERASALILVSAMAPAWTPDARIARCLRFPWLMTPVFCLGSLRFLREIGAATGSTWSATTMAWRHAGMVVRHPFHPARMARRVRLLSSARIETALAGVTTPAVVITGEDSLDMVVPPALSRTYLKLLPQATTTRIARTGHLGIVTRPDEFARIVATIALEQAATAPRAGSSEAAAEAADPRLTAEDSTARRRIG
jgi:pimeloyl-ACP methyl ester carboxylesterase